MNNLRHFLVFLLDERQFALHLSDVERVVRVVDITAVPRAPAAVIGVVNVHGSILPVISARRQLGLPDRELDLGDQLIILNTSGRTSALLVDSVLGVVRHSQDSVVSSSELISNLDQVEGVMNLAGQTVVIQNLDALREYASLGEGPASQS